MTSLPVTGRFPQVELMFFLPAFIPGYSLYFTHGCPSLAAHFLSCAPNPGRDPHEMVWIHLAGTTGLTWHFALGASGVFIERAFNCAGFAGASQLGALWGQHNWAASLT